MTANTLDPALMGEKGRLRELAHILADGYLRLLVNRGQNTATGASRAPEKRLDSSGDQSEGCNGG